MVVRQQKHQHRIVNAAVGRGVYGSVPAVLIWEGVGSMLPGVSFENGKELWSHEHRFGETLFVVRRDRGYAVDRFLVKDQRGRHGYAF